MGGGSAARGVIGTGLGVQGRCITSLQKLVGADRSYKRKMTLGGQEGVAKGLGWSITAFALPVIIFHYFLHITIHATLKNI